MPRIRTIISEMFGIDYPIIGAPMFQVSNEHLAVAVTEAGGLGCISLTNYQTVDQLSDALSRIRQRTVKPIGVNIHLSGKFEWRKQLAVCLDKGVELFITALGDPSLVIEDIHRSGGKVFTSVIYLKHAKRAADRGVDGLIATGAGAGGHCGSISTMVLVPYIRKETDLPILAAGGIGTGSQMAAAFSLGASGVVIGTRLIATPEASSSAEYKQAVIDALPEDIVFTDRITGNVASWIGKSIDVLDTPTDPFATEWKNLWSAGQSVAQVREVMSAGEVIAEMIKEYEEVVSDMPILEG